MEVSGKIIAKLQLQEGIAKSSGRAWKKQEYVLETHDSYPRKVKFDFFGERVDQFPLEIGDEVTISFDIESREFNGRWYTDIRGWKAEKGMPGTSGPLMPPAGTQAPAFDAAPQAPAAFEPEAPGFSGKNDALEDLPF